MIDGPSLPRLASALLRIACPPDDRASVLADFEDAYLAQRRAGRATALRWCIVQVALSLPPLVVRRVQVARAGRGGSAGSMIVDLLADARYAARVFRRSPVVAISTIVAIAGGIAAATAVFSVMEGIFLRPLPFVRPDELVQIGTIIERFGSAAEMNYLDANDVRAQATTLADVAQFDVGQGTLRVRPDDPALSVTVTSVDRHLAGVLGIAPALGRAFLSAEFENG